MIFNQPTLGIDIRPIHSFPQKTPLQLAIEKGNLDLVKFIIQKSPNLDLFGLMELSMIDFRIYEYMVSLPGISQNLSQNGRLLTPLQILCIKNHPAKQNLRYQEIIEKVKTLAPMAKETTFFNNDTPLHFAAKYGSIEILEILIEHLDTNVKNVDGFLPIDQAILHGKVEALKFLAPYTRILKINKKFKTKEYKTYMECNNTQTSKALKVMKTLIDEKAKKMSAKKAISYVHYYLD